MEKEDQYFLLLPKPPIWYTALVTFHADIIYLCLVTLFSPFFSIMSIFTESYHKAEKATEKVEEVVHVAAKIPSNVTRGGMALLRKLGKGIIGAVYACMILVVVLFLSIVFGFVLVQYWVEEPIYIRERLYFDYTEANPHAVYSFRGGSFGFDAMNKVMNVPVGHTVYVSLFLLMPESDFNRQVGVFQVHAELLSNDGGVITQSSQPCMMRFKSLPIRLTQTLIMQAPLLLGISSETQQIVIDILKHKERINPRTGAVKVVMIPRSGTASLPQVYEAELIITSQLPFAKQIVRNWKFTFYVWTSLYIFITLLIVILCCFRRIIFPTAAAPSTRNRDRELEELAKEVSLDRDRREEKGREKRDISEAFKRWQRHRNKRKAVYMHGMSPESSGFGGSSASSMSISREDISGFAEEEVGDSESVRAVQIWAFSRIPGRNRGRPNRSSVVNRERAGFRPFSL